MVDGLAQDAIDARRRILRVNPQQLESSLGLRHFIAQLEELWCGNLSGCMPGFEGVEDSLQPHPIGFGQIDAVMDQGQLQEPFHEVSLEHGDANVSRLPGGFGLGFGNGTGRGFLSENGQCLGDPEGDVAFLGSQRASGSESDASGAESWIGPTPRGFGLGLGSTGLQFQGLQAGMSVWDRPGQSVDSRRRHDLGTALQGHQ
jgi:hypothetical protein